MEKRRPGRPMKSGSRRVATTVYFPIDILLQIDDNCDNRSEYIVEAVIAKMKKEESDNDNK